MLPKKNEAGKYICSQCGEVLKFKPSNGPLEPEGWYCYSHAHVQPVWHTSSLDDTELEIVKEKKPWRNFWGVS